MTASEIRKFLVDQGWDQLSDIRFCWNSVEYGEGFVSNIVIDESNSCIAKNRTPYLYGERMPETECVYVPFSEFKEWYRDSY